MMSKYNELVDHLVSTMPSNSSPMTNNQERKSFDELYEEYSSLSLEDTTCEYDVNNCVVISIRI